MEPVLTAATNAAALAAPAVRRTRGTFANLAHVVGGEAMLRAANFAATVVIARSGGALLFGIYATSLAYATVAAMIADNGLGIATVRSIGSDRNNASKAFTLYAVTKSLLFIPMVVGLAAVGVIAHLSPLEWAVGSMMVLRTMLQHYCQVNVTALKAVDRMRAIGPIQGLHAATLMALLGVCYVLRLSVYAVIGSMVIAQCMELALELGWIRRIPIHFVRVSLRDCWQLALSSTYAGVTLSLGATVMRLDIIVLSSIAGAAVAGVFAAAQSVILIAYVLGALLASVLFPEMARIVHHAEEFRLYIRHWISIVLWTTVPFATLAIAVGPAALRLMFGKAYLASGGLLAIMVAASPAIVLNAILLHRSFALHQVRTYLGVYGVGALLAAVLDIVLAKSLGSTGIAIAVVIREYLILLAFLTLARTRSTTPDITAPFEPLKSTQVE